MTNGVNGVGQDMQALFQVIQQANPNINEKEYSEAFKNAFEMAKQEGDYDENLGVSNESFVHNLFNNLGMDIGKEGEAYVVETLSTESQIMHSYGTEGDDFYFSEDEYNKALKAFNGNGGTIQENTVESDMQDMFQMAQQVKENITKEEFVKAFKNAFDMAKQESDYDEGLGASYDTFIHKLFDNLGVDLGDENEKGVADIIQSDSTFMHTDGTDFDDFYFSEDEYNKALGAFNGGNGATQVSGGAEEINQAMEAAQQDFAQQPDAAQTTAQTTQKTVTRTVTRTEETTENHTLDMTYNYSYYKDGNQVSRSHDEAMTNLKNDVASAFGIDKNNENYESEIEKACKDILAQNNINAQDNQAFNTLFKMANDGYAGNDILNFNVVKQNIIEETIVETVEEPVQEAIQQQAQQPEVNTTDAMRKAEDKFLQAAANGDKNAIAEAQEALIGAIGAEIEDKYDPKDIKVISKDNQIMFQYGENGPTVNLLENGTLDLLSYSGLDNFTKEAVSKLRETKAPEASPDVTAQEATEETSEATPDVTSKAEENVPKTVEETTKTFNDAKAKYEKCLQQASERPSNAAFNALDKAKAEMEKAAEEDLNLRISQGSAKKEDVYNQDGTVTRTYSDGSTIKYVLNNENGYKKDFSTYIPAPLTSEDTEEVPVDVDNNPLPTADVAKEDNSKTLLSIGVTVDEIIAAAKNNLDSLKDYNFTNMTMAEFGSLVDQLPQEFKDYIYNNMPLSREQNSYLGKYAERYED